MSAQATFPIAITADDKTAKGAASAEKRLVGSLKRVSAVNDASARANERAGWRSSRATLRSLGAIEQASARAFGGRSLTSGLTSRLGAVREAAAAAGSGLGEAASAGSALSTAMTTVGVVAGATIGVIAAAGYAAFKLADGWAKGAAAIGRTAETIGVASKALQEFQAAGERAGVDKGASTGALGGIAQTLNDARYGRNNEALALMTRLGIKFRNGADGQLDTAGMTADLADAIARQKNAQTRRLIASKFGISDAALPMFASGSAQLRADMKDADSTALVLSDDDIAKGKRIARKGAIVDQMKDRAMGAAGSAAAGVTESGYDAIISGGRSIISGAENFGGVVKNSFAPAAEKIGAAAETMLKAVGTWGQDKINRLAAQGQRFRAKFEQHGMDRDTASAMAAMAVAESGGDAKRHQVGGPAYGLFQWEKPRQQLFRKLYGKDIRFASEDEQIDFMRYELGHTEAGAGRKIAAADGAAGKADAATRFYERPKHMDLDAANRSALADAIRQGVPVNVTVHLPNAPKGTRATVTAGNSKQPAISHAMAP